MTNRRVVHVTSAHVWSDSHFPEDVPGTLTAVSAGFLGASNVLSQVVEGVRRHGVRVPRSPLLRALFGGYRVVRAARAIDADIYHFHEPALLIWKWLLVLSGSLVVYDTHEYVPGAITTRPLIPAGCAGP